VTKLHLSAELLRAWAENAQVSADTVKVLDRAISKVLFPAELGERQTDALRVLHHARGFQGIGMSVFPRLMETEVRIAFRAAEVIR
jgi:hypothetical protein